MTGVRVPLGRDLWPARGADRMQLACCGGLAKAGAVTVKGRCPADEAAIEARVKPRIPLTLWRIHAEETVSG